MEPQYEVAFGGEILCWYGGMTIENALAFELGIEETIDDRILDIVCAIAVVGQYTYPNTDPPTLNMHFMAVGQVRVNGIELDIPRNAQGGDMIDQIVITMEALRHWMWRRRWQKWMRPMLRLCRHRRSLHHALRCREYGSRARSSVRRTLPTWPPPGTVDP